MFVAQRFFAPDAGAAGTPPAPAAAPGQAAAGSTTPPAVAPASALQPSAGSEPPEWAKALMAKVTTLEGAKTKAEADKGAAEQKALTVEQQLSAQKSEFEKFRTQATADKITGAVDGLAKGVTFASPAHADAGLQHFRASYKIEVVDGAVLATGADGKPQHLAVAFDGWRKSAAGALFVAAAAQPGPGGLGTAPPGAPQRKPVKEMTHEEFRGMLKDGVCCKLTNDKRAPTVTFKDRSVSRLTARREQLLGAVRGPLGGATK